MRRESPKFNVALFDGDGTLFDSMPSIHACASYAFREVLQRELLIEELLKYGGKPLPEQLRLCAGSEYDESVEQMLVQAYRYYFENNRHDILTYPGVRKTMRKLKHSGVQMGIVTSRGEESLSMILEQNKMYGLFKIFVTADMVPRKLLKPDPYPVNLALQWLGNPDRRRVVMVGDTDNDILAGRRAGVATVGVTYGHMSEEDLRSYNADYYARSFSEVGRIILNGAIH